MSGWVTYGLQFLLQMPLYLVLLAGIILAAVKWRKHPRVSILAIAGFGLIILTTLLGSYVGTSLPVYLHTRGMPASSMGIVLMAVNLISIIFTATGWALIVWALFGWRQESNIVS